MSAYQALYRKYRPQTFDDVVGQQAVTNTLKTQLQSGKLSHAYLFTGSRGTGFSFTSLICFVTVSVSTLMLPQLLFLAILLTDPIFCKK